MNDDGVVNQSRRYFLAGGTAVVGAVGAGFVAVPFIGSWNPSAKAKTAGAPVKADISKIEPGQMITVEWRGKPIYIVRRTKEALATLPKLDSVVSDPHSEASVQPDFAKNEYRSKKEEYLILLAVCTHLGCAPKYRPEVGTLDAEWLGGFFCPCHGSKFDLAGRVYAGVPAPTNLEIPPYHFLNDAVVVIGENEGAA